MNLKLINDYTNTLSMDLVIASVMGDGTLSKSKLYLEIDMRSPTYSLWKRLKCVEAGICHPKFIKKSRNLKDKTSEASELSIKSLSKLLPLTYKSRIDSRNGKKTHSFAFCTKKIISQEWRDAFYIQNSDSKQTKKYRKKLPSDIDKLFKTPFALAIWYLDDGNYNSIENSYRISTGEWLELEIEYLRNCLKVNFDIETSIVKCSGKPHTLYIRQHSRDRFVSLIKPTVEEFWYFHRSILMKPKIKGILNLN